jgi:putative ABC transport system substrate-binding protein
LLLTTGAGQSSAARRLGILFATSEKRAKARGQLGAVVEGLKEHGWIEGQNYTFEYRFADNKSDLLPKLATELIELRPDAILTDGTPATLAAKNIGRTTPILAVSNDPVGSGFIASFSRPGGNITGISLESGELAGRRLQLLTEIVPGLGRVSVLSNSLMVTLSTGFYMRSSFNNALASFRSRVSKSSVNHDCRRASECFPR